VAEGWTVLPGLGSYGASMRSDLLLASVNLDAVEARKPLEYVFVTHTQGAARLKFVTVPSHPLTSANGVRLAYSLDGGPLQLLDFETSGRSDEWKRNVLTNTAVRSRDVPNLVPGRHSLKVYALDPGVVLDRIEIAFDGAPNHYGKPLSASGDAQAWLASPAPAAGAGDAPMAFNFDVATAPDGRTTVRAGAAYDAQRGFGFENGTSAWNGQPWQFSVALKEGNYDVAITFGSAEAAARATVKAELRRLMVAPGDTSHQGSGPAVRRFTVNVRNPAIAARNGVAEGKVDLLPRETGGEGKAWDERLTLEIHAEAGAVRSIDISPATVPTIFLLGDSTVADQADEPFASWGQMLTRFFKPGIAVANHAESGESLRASLSRRRIDKVVSSLRPGDLVLIQFGHNDQKQLFDGSSAPFTTYKNELKTHVDMVRAAGGIPVLVTSVERRRFDGQGHISTTLNDYAEAVRQASRELGTPLIDLHAMSMRLYAAMGAEASASLFAAPPGKQVDNTHHNPYGAFVLARLVAQGLRDTGLPAARYLAADLGQVDPAHPILPGQFNVPPSPVKTSERPRGD
jgi:lysophospholipase L1-like esterase